MKFGVCLPNYGDDISPEGLLKFSIAAESLGYDSAWTTDHLLLPRGSGTPYEAIFESISTLFYVAAKTQRIKLGVSSLVMGMRNPVIVAKQLATLDNLSKGRVILATGAGWNKREFDNLGADFHTRGRRLDKAIKLIRYLWESEGEPVNFQSNFFNVKEGIFLPKPVQKRLTIWIAGSSEAAMKRAVRVGDAWHPNVLPLEIFSKLIGRFRMLNANIPIATRIAVLPGLKENEYIGAQGEKRFALTGNINSDEKAIEQLRRLGIDYVVLALNPKGNKSVEEQVKLMKEMAKFSEVFEDR